jgi:hypothetical protein
MTRFYVRIDRTDGSRTYKGPLPELQAEREVEAWRSNFPRYEVSVWDATNPAVRADVRRFDKATKGRSGRADRYYPDGLARALNERLRRES